MSIQVPDPANGMFIEAGTQLSVGNTTNLARSIEGKTWTGPFSGNGNISTDVYFGNGTWVAVGSSSTNTVTNVHIYYSSDGIIWTGVAGPFGVQGLVTDLSYKNGTWVAVGLGYTGSDAYYSLDGKVWNPCIGIEKESEYNIPISVYVR